MTDQQGGGEREDHSEPLTITESPHTRLRFSLMEIASQRDETQDLRLGSGGDDEEETACDQQWTGRGRSTGMEDER